MPLHNIPDPGTVMDSIEATNFNLSRASHSLGISRATPYNKIKKYKLIIDYWGDFNLSSFPAVVSCYDKPYKRVYAQPSEPGKAELP